MREQPTDYSGAGRTDPTERMGQSDDTDAATVRRSNGTESTASKHDRGNVMLATALVLAALVVLVAASMVLAPTGSDGITSQPVDRSDTDIVREGLSLVFIESRDTLDPSYDPVFTAPDNGDDPPPINYTTVAALLDPHPFTDEQVVQTQYLMSSLAHRMMGGSIASLEPVADRTTTGMLVRLGTNDSREFTDETVLAESATGVQDLMFVLERESLPTSADNATTVEVGDWTVAAYQAQNRVRYQLGSYDPGGNWQETGRYANLRVNTYQGTVNGEAVDSLAVDPGEQEFTVQVLDNRRSDGDSANGSLNLVAVGAGPGDVGNLPEATWQEVVTRPAFNVTYIDATTTFVDRISVDTTYRAFEFATGGSSPGSGKVTLTVETENTSKLVEPGSFDGAGAGGTPGTAGRGEGVSPVQASEGPPPSQQGVWDSGNVWLPDYALEPETEYTITVTVNTSDEITQAVDDDLLSLHTRDENGTLEPCDCAVINLTEATANATSFLVDPYALRETLVLEANTSELPGVEADVRRNLTIVDPYLPPDLALEETATVGEPVEKAAERGPHDALRLEFRNESYPGAHHVPLEELSLEAQPAQALTQFVADQLSEAPTETEMATAVSGLETLREQYTDAFFDEGSEAANELLEGFADASPAEQAAMVSLTGVRAERAIPAFEAINGVVGTVSVNSSDIIAASSPAYAAGAGALVGEPYTAAKLPVLAERASHVQNGDEHPPTWWLTRLANADLSDSQRKTLGRLYGPHDIPHWISRSAWNETIVTFINNIQQFRGATETLWGEGVSDGTLRDTMYEVSGGNGTLRNAIPAVHDEMETAFDFGVNPVVGGVTDIEGFLLAAGLTDPGRATYTEAASLIDSLPDGGEPVTYKDVLFGVAGDQGQLLDESALGETPPSYELASGADLTADWDAALTATYTESSPEHGHTLGSYRASDMVTVSGLSSTEIAGFSVRLTANASVAALRDSGLLNGSEAGPQPLVVGQPRGIEVTITYVNGTTERVSDPVKAGVNLELVGPTGGGGADVPSAPNEFATLDIENNTITAQAATGNWTGDGSSGPITLQASLGDLTDTATAQAVTVSARGVARWGGLFGPRNTTVYTDATFGPYTLYVGLEYTARLGKPGLDWQNRTLVGVARPDIGSVTNENTTAATLTPQADDTYELTPKAVTALDAWQTVTTTNITESGGLNLSVLGFAAASYDAQAAYRVRCHCEDRPPVTPEKPHIMTYPRAAGSEPRMAINDTEQGSYTNGITGVGVNPPDTSDTIGVSYLPDPRASTSRSNQQPRQPIQTGQTGNIYVWSNFRAAVTAAENPERLRFGNASWRSPQGCNEQYQCLETPMAMVDHIGTTTATWSSSIERGDGSSPNVALEVSSQSQTSPGAHGYSITPTHSESVDQQLSMDVTGTASILDGGVNSPTWDITVKAEDQDDGGSKSPVAVSLSGVPDTVLIGEEFSPTVTVTNIGDAPLLDITVTQSDGQGGDYSWTTTLQEGETTSFSGSVKFGPGSTGDQTVFASASAEGESDSDSATVQVKDFGAG